MVSVIYLMKEKVLPYKDEQKLCLWNSRSVTKTRPEIKNDKIAQTEWEDFSNDDTCLMKELALLFKVCVTLTMLTV